MNNHYEDEIDRMRARHSRRKERAVHKAEHARYDYDWNEAGRDACDDRDFVDFRSESRGRGSYTRQEERGSRRGKSKTRTASARGGRQTGHNQADRRSGRNKRKKKKPFLLLFILVLLVAGAGIYIRQGMTQTGYWTIAVFGVDSRDGNMGKGALSDVEMLCSINRQTGEIRLASVFRDSYLRIDQESQYDKINEAYFLGGYEQAVAALEDNLDLEIDDYATFNWKAVIDAINVLGGVDLEITDKEFAYINSFITETVESTGVGSYHLEHSGMNHLDGVQAVAYARLRLMDTDFNRTERQRKVLGLAMEKAKAADAGTLKSLVAVVFPQVSTSVGVDDLLAMAKNAKKYYIGQTSGFPFSHVEMKIGKKACVIPATLESNVIQLHGFLYDDSQYQISETVREISRHIASESGVGEPGKDTESGKNVGAQGNSQSSNASPQPAPQQTAAQPEGTAPMPGESAAETEISQDPAGETGSDDSGETDSTVEATEEERGEPGAGESEASGEENQPIGPGNQGPGGQDIGGQSPSGGQGPGGQTSSGDQGAGGQTPSGGQDTGNQTPFGSLEAPGQQKETSAQPGPGSSGSGPGSSGTTQGGSGQDSQTSSGNGAVAGPGM